MGIIETLTLKGVNYSPCSRRKGAAVLIPVSDTIPGMFVSSAIKAYTAILKAGGTAFFSIMDTVPLDRARELLCNDALSLEPELEYVLWLDADMHVEESHVSELMDYLQSHPEADVASALYFSKLRHEPVCYKKQPDAAPNERKYMRFMPPTSDPTEVDAVGMGCMLIRTRSLKEKLLPSLPEPKRLFWFDYMGNSEDLNFCSLMQSAGMCIFVLPGVVVQHYGGMVGRWHYEQKEKEGKE